MTHMQEYAALLEKISREFRAIAATERRWDGANISAYAQTLDRIALDLFVDGEADEPSWGSV